MGDRTVKRLGYGAMQLAGPGVLGPPKDRSAAVAVLREAVASGVDHIDTSDIYGPHVTNQILREALHPYPKELVIVTKVGGKRGPQGSWDPALSAEEITSAVDDNLRNLRVDALDVVNLRIMFDPLAPKEGGGQSSAFRYPRRLVTVAALWSSGARVRGSRHASNSRSRRQDSISAQLSGLVLQLDLPVAWNTERWIGGDGSEELAVLDVICVLGDRDVLASFAQGGASSDENEYE